jgi:hypothetical protein
MTRLILAIALWPILVAAVLQVGYPLNLQLPPIALVDAPYQYQFPSTTFQTDSNNVEYSLVGGPSWLSLDSKSRTLSGTPHSADVGEVNFKIVAAGFAGAVVNMDSRLLVSKDSVVKGQGNVTQVLSNAGPVSGPYTLSLGPAKPINISFPSDSFGSNATPLSYYALLSDHTPLPAWISFDASSLHFAGTTPTISSAQTFQILLVACATPGYATSSLNFTIAISNHQLIFQPYSQPLKIRQGEDVQITDLKSRLYLDGSPIRETDIQSINATLPSWLKLDNQTSEILGTPPFGLMSQDVTVMAKDRYGDLTQFTIHLRFTSELFTEEIGQLNATIGESFEFVIPRDILVSHDEKLSVELSSLSRYLRFDPTTLTISGTIPKDFHPQTVQCILTASTSSSTLSGTQGFQIAVSKAIGDGNFGTSSGDANTSSTKDKTSNAKTAGIIVGSIIGSISVTLLLVTLVICLHRRKKKNSYMNTKLPRSPRKSDIGHPMFVPHGWPDTELDQDHDQDVEKGKDEHDSLMEHTSERTPEFPPKLDLYLPVNQRDSRSIDDSMSDADTKILDTFEDSSWGIQNDITPSQHPHDSMKIPTELAKRSSLKSDSFRKHKRRTTTVYHDQIHRSSGLPVNRRIRGMGHNRHTYSPSRSDTNMSHSSMRRAPSTSSYTTTRCTSTFSTAPTAFPQPPLAEQHTTRVTSPAEQRRSIRAVPASIRSSVVDRQTLDEKRSSYIRKRASAQSPFFSATGSRISSAFKTAPAFIAEVPSKSDTIVNPGGETVQGAGKGSLDSLTIPGPSTTPPSETGSKEFPGSLRRNRVARPHTSIALNRDRVEKSYARPRTTISPSTTGMGRRASARDSLRAYNLKFKLNNLTGSEIFKDAELSDSVYTDEEVEIDEAEKRATVRPGEFKLLPLNIDTRRRSKRDSAEKTKRTSKRDSNRALKRTNERKFRPFLNSGQPLELPLTIVLF